MNLGNKSLRLQFILQTKGFCLSWAEGLAFCGSSHTWPLHFSAFTVSHIATVSCIEGKLYLNIRTQSCWNSACDPVKLRNAAIFTGEMTPEWFKCSKNITLAWKLESKDERRWISWCQGSRGGAAFIIHPHEATSSKKISYRCTELHLGQHTG